MIAVKSSGVPLRSSSRSRGPVLSIGDRREQERDERADDLAAPHFARAEAKALFRGCLRDDRAVV